MAIADIVKQFIKIFSEIAVSLASWWFITPMLILHVIPMGSSCLVVAVKPLGDIFAGLGILGLSKTLVYSVYFLSTEKLQ